MIHDPESGRLSPKNAYMIKHWQEYCAGRFPKDPLLEEGRSRFFETLLINPIDYSALNGLGNILLFQGELDCGRIFREHARSHAPKRRRRLLARRRTTLELIQSRLKAAEAKVTEVRVLQRVNVD